MFLALYTLCIVLLYWIVPEKKRPWILILSSLFLLSWWDLYSTLWTSLLSFLTWFGVRKKWARIFLISGLLLQLILAKLFLDTSPLGLSFTTFCLLHYLIDRKRGTLPSHTLGEFLSWCYFFPIFSAGPIEKLDHFLKNQSSSPNWMQGLKRISFGLIKKWILVEWLLEAWSGKQLLQEGLSLSFGELWILLLLLFIKLYLDFSAYCDLALGTAHLFGFKIIENF